MALKQILKQLQKVVFLGLIVFLLAQFFAYFSFPHRVRSQDNTTCFYTYGLGSYVAKPPSNNGAAVIEYFSGKDKVNWDDESWTIKVKMVYSPESIQNTASCAEQGQFKLAFRNSSNQKVGLVDLPVSISRGADGRGATVTGEASINPTLSVFRGNEQALREINAATQAQPYIGTFHVVYFPTLPRENPELYGFGAGIYKLAHCQSNNPTDCPRNTDSGPLDTPTGDPTAIILNDLKIDSNTFVDEKSMVPQSIQDDPKANGNTHFIRLYYNENGEIAFQDASGNEYTEFRLGVSLAMKGPLNKTLGIDTNSDKASNIYMQGQNPETDSKDAKSLGVGLIKPNKYTSSTGTIGCYKTNTSANTSRFLFCKYPIINMGTGFKMAPGQPSLLWRTVLNKSKLAELEALQGVSCQNGQCDDVYNTIDVYTTFGLEQTFLAELAEGGWGSTAICALLVIPTGGVGGAICGAIVFGQQLTGSYNDIPISFSPPRKFYIQIYPTEDEWKAHIDDDLPPGVGEYQNNIETSAQAESTSVTTTLFNFVRKVIVYITIQLTGFIYRTFAFILVPILNVLLNMHPYEDKFVNFIYPGWIIIRNLANIAFIVALLIMGLRILFQIEGSDKSKGFIVNIILMALLVNFSLVLAQGVVGIADTVQSQFLPPNSNVIEALGAKLMAEPIIAFQSGFGGTSAFGDAISFTDVETNDATASDLFKPLVLFFLALAAFFAFLALIAFILIRLVALWVLYMTSPFAYFGRVLPQTKPYADRWWTEFIKYAFTVPILAFFLNMAALIAVTFSATQGDSVEARGYLKGTYSGDLVEFALTVISHFVVIGFLFAGMKFAQSSGTFGAKQIVGFAKKGLNAVLVGGPKALGSVAGWAKNTGGDAIASKLEDKDWNKLGTAVRFGAQPVTGIKAVKKGYFDEPKAAMNDRFKNSFARLSQNLQPWGEDKLLPAKMALGKLGLDNARTDQSRAKRSKAQILTAQEIKDKNEQLKEAKDRLALLKGGEMTVAEGRQRLTDLGELIKRNEAEITSDALLPSEKTKLEAENVELKSKQGELTRVIDDALKSGEINFRIDSKDVAEALKPVVDLDQEKRNLEKTKFDIEKDLTQNDRLKKFHQFDGDMTDKMRSQLNGEAEALATKVQKMQWPVSDALEKAERGEVSKLRKEIADSNFDMDQLEDGLFSAIKRNNSAEAKAFFLEMANNGQVDKLLKNHNQPYNSRGLAAFVTQNIGGTERTQMDLIRQVSTLAGKNGNLPLTNAVRSLRGGGGELRNIDQQLKEISDKVKKLSIKEMKKSDAIFVNPKSGREETIPGMADKLNSMSNTERLKEIRRMNRDVAKEIVEKMPADEKSKMTKQVFEALNEAAGT